MEAPFSPNQKVVVVKTLGPLKKGDIYTVGECFQCPKCKSWHVGLMEYPSIGGALYDCFQNGCTEVLRSEIPHYMGAAAKFFAPLPEQRERINYVAVSETMREAAVETFITQTN